MASGRSRMPIQMVYGSYLVTWNCGGLRSKGYCIIHDFLWEDDRNKYLGNQLMGSARSRYHPCRRYCASRSCSVWSHSFALASTSQVKITYYVTFNHLPSFERSRRFISFLQKLLSRWLVGPHNESYILSGHQGFTLRWLRAFHWTKFKWFMVHTC